MRDVTTQMLRNTLKVQFHNSPFLKNSFDTSERLGKRMSEFSRYCPSIVKEQEYGSDEGNRNLKKYMFSV